MHLSILALIWVFLSYLLYKIAASYLSGRRHAANAQRLGCEPAPLYPTKRLLGIDVLQTQLKAIDEMRSPQQFFDMFEQMHADTFRLPVLGAIQLNTRDPKNIEALLASQFDDFEKGSVLHQTLKPFLGEGIFSTDGDMWKHSRALLRPQFAREQVAQLDLEERHVNAMMAVLSIGEGGWTEEIDLGQVFFRFTLDSATEFLFGESLGSQLASLHDQASQQAVEDGEPDPEEFVKSWDLGTYLLTKRGRLGKYQWLRDNAEWRMTCKKVHNFADYYVRKALAQHQELEKAGGDREKGRFVFLENLVQRTQNPMQLRTQSLNILLAGRDTTAGLLGWLFYVLAREPIIFQKLRAVILADFGSYDSPQEITFAKLNHCTYLQHCLSEVNRLYTLVPRLRRVATRNTTLPRGGGPDGTKPLYVQKGQSVVYSFDALHRRKDIWGVDADEFRPDRWQGKKYTDWSYVPFSAGPRKCLGQQFALTEASFVAVRLMQRFDEIENVDTDPVTHNRVYVTSSPGNGVQVRLHQAVRE